MIYLIILGAFLFGFFTAAILSSSKYEDRLKDMKRYYEEEEKWG